MKSHSAGIAGVGHALPQRVVDNSAIAEQIGRTPEWIARRTGIRTRHWLAEGECLADICAKAARRALQDASLAAGDVDLILLATVPAEQSFPSVACRVQEHWGARGPLPLICPRRVPGLSLPCPRRRPSSFLESIEIF